MGLLDLFKLEKLKIKAFTDAKRNNAASPGEFEAMFNPTSFKQSFGIAWSEKQGINSSGRQAGYQRTKPSQLDLSLIVDGTGLHEMGVLALRSPPSVAERIEALKDVAYRYNGKIHEPNYLLVEWGVLSFLCRLQRLDVTYNLFDRDGTPLRAELELSLVADDEPGRRTRLEDKKSPDLTHTRTVVAGDTLPLLAHAVYGSSKRYVDVARYNGLDDFRRLEPGRDLDFPPLDLLPREADREGRE